MTTEKDSLEHLTKHYKLLPYQEKLLHWFMEEPEARTHLLMYGRQTGKSQMKAAWLKYMLQIGNEIEKQQDPFETN